MHEHFVSNRELLHIEQNARYTLVASLKLFLESQQESYYNLLMKGKVYDAFCGSASFKFACRSSPTFPVKDGVYNGYVKSASLCMWTPASVYVKHGFIDADHELNKWMEFVSVNREMFMVHIQEDVWNEMKNACVINNIPSPAEENIMDAWRFLCEYVPDMTSVWIEKMDWDILVYVIAAEDYPELPNKGYNNTIGETLCVLSQKVCKVNVNGISSSVKLINLNGYAVNQISKYIHSLECIGGFCDETTELIRGPFKFPKFLMGEMVIKELDKPDVKVQIHCEFVTTQICKVYKY